MNQIKFQELVKRAYGEYFKTVEPYVLDNGTLLLTEELSWLLDAIEMVKLHDDGTTAWFVPKVLLSSIKRTDWFHTSEAQPYPPNDGFYFARVRNSKKVELVELNATNYQRRNTFFQKYSHYSDAHVPPFID